MILLCELIESQQNTGYILLDSTTPFNHGYYNTILVEYITNIERFANLRSHPTEILPQKTKIQATGMIIHQKLSARMESINSSKVAPKLPMLQESTMGYTYSSYSDDDDNAQAMADTLLTAT